MFKFKNAIKQIRFEIMHNLFLPPNTFFFGNALKKTIEYFLKFLFLFEIKILPVNNGK